MEDRPMKNGSLNNPRQPVDPYQNQLDWKLEINNTNKTLIRIYYRRLCPLGTTTFRPSSLTGNPNKNALNL